MKKKKPNNELKSMPPVYGDPVYGEEEDIYARGKKVELTGDGDETDDIIDLEINPGADLDVPGAEMDDSDEKAGSEDEENNYYSIGGDNHNNLEEENEDDIGEEEDYDNLKK